MSYRVYVNDTQIFGNNDSYTEWEEFVKSQGIEVGEDGEYDGEITDVQGMFEVIDKITRRLIAERHEEVLRGETDFKGCPKRELTDLTGSMWLKDDVPLLMFGQQMVENAFCFLPYQLYVAVKDVIKYCPEDYEKDGVDWTLCKYKIKDGEKIHIHAS